MTTSPRRVSSCWLQVLALGLVATAAWLSRGRTDPPAAEGPPAAAALRAVGIVHPRLSPDGKEVVFSYQGTIWRMPAAGGVMKRLAAGAFAFEPCWSPDGRHVAFFQGKAFGSGLLKIIDAQTGKPVPLAPTVLASGKLYFTPDGGAVVGKLRTEKQLESLRAVDLKTGELKTVLRLPSMRQPWALSDDGQWLAYVSTMDQPEQQSGNDGPQAELWKVPYAGGDPERIVRFPARVYDLCWAPDNKGLIVTSDLGGVHNDLWRIDLNDPERPAKLTSGQADEDRPSLSRDGRWLLYTDNRGGAPGLVKRDLVAGTESPLTVERLDFGTTANRLLLKVLDKDTSQPATVRAAIEHADGSFHAPPGALWRIYRDLGHFYANGTTTLDLPTGAYRVHLWHGPEFRPRTIPLEILADRPTELAVSMERWTDANARGWYGGDNHIHANYGYGEYYNTPASMALMCAGEGLNVCNFMVANSDSDGVFDREFFRGRPDPLSTARTVLYWNEEFRSTIWGHMTLVYLKQVVEPVFTGFKDTTNPYDIPSMSEISWKTRRQGGLVNYTHPASLPTDLYRGAYAAKGLPIYAALGKIDTMDVMGSGDRASSALYHRLLNCGLRLSASAGTDCFLNRIRSWLPGGERAYVRVEGPFTYEKWIASLRAGRSFVSNGPMLELSANGQEIGSTLDLAGAKEVKVKVKAESQFPLDKVEVLYNGQVALTIPVARDGLQAEGEQNLKLDRSGWIALRASGPAVPFVKSEWVYAHTSPVYVNVAGQPAGSSEDARYFLAWIDRHWELVQERDRFPDERSKAEVQAEVTEARKIYQRIIDRGNAR